MQIRVVRQGLLGYVVGAPGSWTLLDCSGFVHFQAQVFVHLVFKRARLQLCFELPTALFGGEQLELGSLNGRIGLLVLNVPLNPVSSNLATYLLRFEMRLFAAVQVGEAHLAVMMTLLGVGLPNDSGLEASGLGTLNTVHSDFG